MWSAKEDAALRELVERLGTNRWKEVADSISAMFGSQAVRKTSRQCRDRWLNCINPEIKRYLLITQTNIVIGLMQRYKSRFNSVRPG